MKFLRRLLLNILINKLIKEGSLKKKEYKLLKELQIRIEL